MASRPPSLGAEQRKAAAAAARQPKLKTLRSAEEAAALRAAWARHDAQRPASSKRGYGAKWRATRRRFLAQQPLCAMCLAAGRYTPATLVDHITPVQSDADPNFYRPDNLQSLCRPCHAQKTAADIAAGATRGPARSARRADDPANFKKTPPPEYPIKITTFP